jgi:hypothetical protein
MIWLVAGCPSPASKPSVLPADTGTMRNDDAARLARLFSELQDDVLTSYERDEPPDLDSTMIDPRVGTARIGAGPDDVYIARDLARAPSRWPLDVDRATRTEVRSKHLAIQIAADQSAAWSSDELSWRIEMCGRTAVIPLRITALYAHDGDRWVPVFEHLSYGFAPNPASAAMAKPMQPVVASADLGSALAGVVDRGLLRTPHEPAALAQDASALVIGPDVADEWQGEQVLAARIPSGKLEERRIGTVGRGPRAPTIAYWVGNYLADIPAVAGVAAGKIRMRATFVFEKRPVMRDGTPADPKICIAGPSPRDPGECVWSLVQTHMSQPITDDQLTQQVFGTARLTSKPLALDCSEGTVPIAPAAAPRPAAHSPPAAQSR